MNSLPCIFPVSHPSYSERLRSTTTFNQFLHPPDPVCQPCPDCHCGSSVRQLGETGGGGGIKQSNVDMMKLIMEAVSRRHCRSIIIRADWLQYTSAQICICFDICARLIRENLAGLGSPPPQMRIQEGDRCETSIHHIQTNNNFACISAAVCTKEQHANKKPNQLRGKENSGPSRHGHVAVCFFIHWNDHGLCLPNGDCALRVRRGDAVRASF